MKCLLFTALFIITACSKSTYPQFDYNQSTNPWMDAFKDQVFFAALVKAYKSDSSIFKLIKEKDLFNPYDGIDLEEMQKATELGKNLIRNIPPPSMCENCPDGMNYYMASSLHYYHSRELDSIAKHIIACI